MFLGFGDLKHNKRSPLKQTLGAIHSAFQLIYSIFHRNSLLPAYNTGPIRHGTNSL